VRALKKGGGKTGQKQLRKYPEEPLGSRKGKGKVRKHTSDEEIVGKRTRETDGIY